MNFRQDEEISTATACVCGLHSTAFLIVKERCYNERSYFLIIIRMAIIVNLLLSALAVGIAAYLTPGVTIVSVWDAVVVAVVLALVNSTIGFVLRIIALPVSIVTLGLASFLVGILMIYLTDALVPGFGVADFWAALVFAVLLALVTSVLGVRKPA